jgi:hypothetical protein
MWTIESMPLHRRSSRVTRAAACCCAVAVCLIAGRAMGARGQEAGAAIAYPDGYRTWAHVKSTVMTSAHASFPENGGFHHIYANAPALQGYRTRQFSDGSTIVFDWLEARENAGLLVEGPRRRVDVMVKDATRFAATGGWGFERFAGDSRTERAATPPRSACFACHQKLAKDGLVLSTLRD